MKITIELDENLFNFLSKFKEYEIDPGPHNDQSIKRLSAMGLIDYKSFNGTFVISRAGILLLNFAMKENGK